MLKIKPSPKKLLPLLAVLLGTQSCVDPNNFDFENVESVSLKPAVALPLLHGKLTIGDLLPEEESSYIREDEDKLIHLIYSDTLASRSILDNFLLPQLFIEDTYPVPLSVTGLPGSPQHFSQTYQEVLNLDFAEADFDEVKLKKGEVLLTARHTTEVDINLNVTFPTLQKDGVALSIEIQLPGNSGSEDYREIDLAGYSIDLSGFGTGENHIPVDISISASNENGSLLADGLVDFRLDLKELEYSLLTGYFGELEVDLPSDEVELASFEDIFSKANFGFKDAELSFDVINTNGVPIEATVHELYARNSEGGKINILINPPSPVAVSAPAAPGERVITPLAITNEEDVFNFAPSAVVYRLTGRINAGAPVGTRNFLTDKSETTVVLNADVPLWGYLEGFSLSDTLDFELELESEQEDYISEASIKINVQNQFPLDADIKVDFVDANNNVLETLFEEGYYKLLPGSEVDANGEITRVGVLDDEIMVTSERFERILKAEKIIIRANLQTSQFNGTHPHVKIKADQALSINLGVKAAANNLKIDLNTENEE